MKSNSYQLVITQASNGFMLSGHDSTSPQINTIIAPDMAQAKEVAGKMIEENFTEEPKKE